MRPILFRSLALAATAAFALAGCAGKQDPTAETTTSAAGLGSYGDPNAAGVGAGAGAQPYVLGGNDIPGGGVDVYGRAGGAGPIDGTALGGVGAYSDGGLVDGGIISAAPQYEDGTIYTDTTVYNDGSFTQPYDATLFDDTGAATGAGQFSTYTGQNGASLGGYSFPGDTGQQSYLTTQVGNRVLFQTDSVILTADARETLRRQAAWLQLHPEHRAVILEGHADERGTREYNLALGARRADAVRAFLSSLGIEASRLRTVSYGKERPLSLGSGPNDWAKNRRVETVIGGGASF